MRYSSARRTITSLTQDDAAQQPTRYEVARTPDAREAQYRLRYDGYRREGLIPQDDAAPRFRDRFDDDANAVLIATQYSDLVVGTLRIHVVDSDHASGPAFSTFGDILTPLVEAGERLIDPSRFVIAPEIGHRSSLPFIITRLACMAAEHFEADWMLASVRAEHAAFYKRFCNLDVLSEPRPYPGLSRPLLLMGARNEVVRDRVFARYPIFSSTFAERVALFGTERRIDALAPPPEPAAVDRTAPSDDERRSGRT